MAPNKREREDATNEDKGAAAASPSKITRRSFTSRNTRSSSNHPKNIIFNFDGTGKDEFQPGALPEKPNVDGSTALSNVSKLHLFFGGDFREDTYKNFYDMTDQVSLYYSGVGTDGGNSFLRLLEKAFAAGDVDKIIKEALEDLRKLYNPGDKIYVTGFSRGAATARKFCSVVAKAEDLKDVPVELLVVFDTVASIGAPDISEKNRPDSAVLFEDDQVAPNVKQAVHCVAMDDKRPHFQPTLMNQEPKVTEVWFVGNHGDIGGGWIQDGLSDITLQYALDFFEEHDGLHILSPEEVKYDEINKATKGVDVDPQDLSIDPDPLGTSHEQEVSMLYYHRDVVVISDDEIVEDGLPLVYYTVGKRIQEMDDYRPPGLKDTKHLLLHADGTTQEMSGLDDYLNDDEQAPPRKRARKSKCSPTKAKTITPDQVK